MSKRCTAKSKKNKRCKKNKTKNSDYCLIHTKPPPMPTVVPTVTTVTPVADDPVTPVAITTKTNVVYPDFVGPHRQQLMKLYEINLDLPKQRSVDWYKLRKTRITASDYAKALILTELEMELAEKGEFWITEKQGLCTSCSPYETPTDLIKKKCGVKKDGGIFEAAVYHGCKYECAATAMYEQKNNTTVIEYGCMPHPTIEFLGASPDGITIDGTMLEIKVPWKRKKITDCPKIDYWMQTQLQMACCGFQDLDFVECVIEEYATMDDYINDCNGDNYHLSDDGLQKGIVIEVQRNERPGKFFCMPLNCKNHDEMCNHISEWAEQYLSKKKNKHLFQVVFQNDFEMSDRRIKIHPWKCVLYTSKKVKFNKEWFEKRLPDAQAVWEKIETYRKDGVPEELLKPKKSKSKYVGKFKKFAILEDSEEE